MELAPFIQKHGSKYCAELFGFKIRTINSWRNLERVPDVMSAGMIITKAGGAINWDDIYRPYYEYYKDKLSVIHKTPRTKDVVCACGCGRSKKVRIYDINRGRGKYYSKSCKDQHQKALQKKPKVKPINVN